MKQLQSSKLLISPFSENEFIGICKAYKNKRERQESLYQEKSCKIVYDLYFKKVNN